MLKKSSLKAFSGKQCLVQCYLQGLLVEKLWDTGSKERLHVPKHTSVQVECRVQTSAPKEERVLLYEPDVTPTWPEGLEFCETLVKLRRQTSPHVIVTVQNPTDHDIMLNGKTVIGTVHPVQAVYPAAALETPLSEPVNIIKS